MNRPVQQPPTLPPTNQPLQQLWVPSDPPSARHSHCAAIYKNGIYIAMG